MYVAANECFCRALFVIKLKLRALQCKKVVIQVKSKWFLVYFRPQILTDFFETCIHIGRALEFVK